MGKGLEEYLFPESQEDLINITHPTGVTGERMSSPTEFKVSRLYASQAKDGESSFWSLYLAERKGLSKIITESDLSSFAIAIAKIYYSQDHTTRHKGLAELKPILGDTEGIILSTLNEISRESYGEIEPTSDQKKKIKQLITALHNNPITIKDRKGEPIEFFLITQIARKPSPKTGAITYLLKVNNLYLLEAIKNDYIKFPSDVMFRLTDSLRERKLKNRGRYIKLMRYLSQWTKTGVKKINFDTILSTIEMTDYYRKDKKKGEKLLSSLYSVMKDIGLLRSDLSENPVYSAKDNMITFYLNKEWSKDKNIELLPLQNPPENE
nr:unnamed protein product [uncultured bacterium]